MICLQKLESLIREDKRAVFWLGTELEKGIREWLARVTIDWQ